MYSEKKLMNEPDLHLEFDLNLQFLRAELARLDVRLQRAVQCWQLAGQDPADAFRGLYVSDDEVQALLARPLGMNWGQTVKLEPATADVFTEAEAQAAKEAEGLRDMARDQGVRPRLDHLAQVFRLDPFDLDVLLICLAPSLDLRYEKLYGYLQDDVTRKRPGVNLALDLLCPPGFERLLALSHFTADAPLFRYQLLERFSEPGQNKSPVLSQSLRIDETIVHWLLGSYRPAGELAPYLRLDPAPVAVKSQGYLPEGDDIYSDDFLSQNPLFIFYGPDRLAQAAAVQNLAAHAKHSLLTLDLTVFPKEEISLHQTIRTALQDARLTKALLFIQGWDACLEDGIPAADLFSDLARHPGIVVLAGEAAWRPAGLPETRPVHWREFPIPAYPERKALWAHHLERANQPANLDLTGLAGQFALTGEQIRDAVLLAVNQAVRPGDALSEDDLMAAARVLSSSRLSNLARKVPARYGWEDIVLPADQISLLHEIVATVRGRPTVLEEWGLGRKLASSYGVSLLFAGPPGTGKTLAAQIIAAELGLDLYKIDLSTLVSKYIGETEKNLERIFTEAESSNAILFFDEADALFGKRSEVRDSHDRYANVEISYLLQRMEAYDGVTILATNLRSNLDEAFTRRLQFAVDFPFPEEGDRLLIWQALFPSDVPRADLDLALMAHRYKLAGGNIRNIIVSAAYLANANGGVVTMEHLLHGTRRELQKMGRLVNE
jgi:hypothetical protein